MKKIIASICCAVLVAIASISPALAVTFGQVVDGVDLRKNTKLAAKENFGKYKGQEVSWSGVVYEVQGKASKAKVLVTDKSRPLYKGYNIVLVTKDEKAANLKKGQAISFKGTLATFSAKKEGAVVTLKNVDIR